MNKIIRYMIDREYRFLVNAGHGLYKSMPDDEYLKRKFKATLGYDLNLESPQTFNEKIQWLKLHDHNPLYTTLVDKVAVKGWVRERIGDEYVTPTYAVWESVDDIDIGALPDRFVLKTNHDSGGIAICRNKEAFDLSAAKNKLRKSMRRNYYWGGREWPYKDVRPCVFAEQYLEGWSQNELSDCKFFCFDGRARAMFIATERFGPGETKFDFFDMDFKRIPVTNGHPNADVILERPDAFDEMRVVAERLSEGIPHVRVDFYETPGGVYFGEMTFYHWSGFVPFDPAEYDEMFGSWIILPESVGGGVLMSDDWMLWLHDEEGGRIANLEMLPAGMVDYKFYCFGGEPLFLYVSEGLEDHKTARISFLTTRWEFAPFSRGDYKSLECLPDKPRSLTEMLELARRLAEGIPFVRVDFYEVDGRPRFSEMTFHPCSGFMPFEPSEFDFAVGDLIDLTKVYCKA